MKAFSIINNKIGTLESPTEIDVLLARIWMTFVDTWKDTDEVTNSIGC